MAKITKEAALLYHSMGKPGKIEVIPTKPYSTQTDLSLAYSPGVAEPCLEIEKSPIDAYKYTAKGNLVAVISNGTAVLGLGNIGALAGKPVMEGKGLLFKIYAGIDVFDIEVNETDPDKFVEAVKAIAPTFGGINLEDIKAPECFEIERRLKEELDIPVMHDDQHGTAIISSAGLLNALEVAGKKIEDVKIVVNGAGASAVSCTKLYLSLGARLENVVMLDSKGVIRKDREGLNEQKRFFATDRDIHTLAEAPWPKPSREPTYSSDFPRVTYSHKTWCARWRTIPSSSPWPIPRRRFPTKTPWPLVPTCSCPQAVQITLTKSIMSSASPTSSAVLWIPTPRPSTKR